MNNKVKTLAGGLMVFALGFATGTLIDGNSNSSNLKGDISKVNKFHKSVVSDQMSAFQEKILNDSTEMAQTNVSIALLTSRMREFSQLVDVAEDAVAGKSEFASNIEELKSVKRISDNAAASGNAAGEAFSSVAAGKKDALAASYEQSSQNFTIAYLMVNRQMDAAKEFVATADSYLTKNGIDNNKNLALARDLWAQYCAGESVLNGDKDEMIYWSKKESALKGEDFATTYNTVADSTLQLAVVMDHLCGLANSVCPNPELLNMTAQTVQNHGTLVVLTGAVVYAKDINAYVNSSNLMTVVYNKDIMTAVNSKEILTAVNSKEILTAVNSKEILTAVNSKDIMTVVFSKDIMTAVNSKDIMTAVNSKEILTAVNSRDISLNTVMSKVNPIESAVMSGVRVAEIVK